MLASMEVIELPRLQVCSLFSIEFPMWNGGKRVIGLDTRRIQKDNEVHVKYVRKSDGLKSFPEPLYFDGDLRKQIDFPVMNRKGTTLLLVPIENFRILRRV